MKKLFICIFILFLPILLFADDSRRIAGSIDFMLGDVFVSTNGKDWQDADFDMEIKEGDQIKTEEESRCEIVLVDGTIVRMDENSIQQFEKVAPQNAAKKKSLFLFAGKVWINTRKILSKGESFRVRTNKAVCAIRGTIFSIDEGKEHTRVQVHKGAVATWSSVFDKAEEKPQKPLQSLKPVPVKGPYPVPVEKWVEIVKAFQQITIDAKGGYEKKDFDIKSISNDPWIAWNMDRDKTASK